MEKKNVRVLVACTNANGSPDFHLFIGQVGEAEIGNGGHYELAKESAAEEGCQGPFVCFDETEFGAIKRQFSTVIGDVPVLSVLQEARWAIVEAAHLASDINNDDLTQLFNEGGSFREVSKKISAILDPLKM